MGKATEAGKIALNLIINPSRLRKELLQVTNTAAKESQKAAQSINNQLSDMTSSATKQMTSAFSGVGKKIGAALSVGAITLFGKSCIDLGSDLSEVQNVVDTAFKSMSSYVDSFAKDAMKNFGLSETVAKQYMGTIGAMNNAFGFTEKASLEMAKAVTGLTGDVASFYNLGSDEAFTKLKSIWTGETETLKDLGVVMTQTALDQYALNNGFGKTTAKMTEQEKVMLRFQYVTSALSNASGDFIKTQDGWANQTRVLQLQMESFKATIGQGLINLFTPLLQMLNQLALKASEAAAVFRDFTEAITGSKASGGGGETAKAMQAITKSAQDATKSVESTETSLASFDKMTKLSSSKASKDNFNGGGNGDAKNLTSDIDKIIKKQNKAFCDFFKPIQKSWSMYGDKVMKSWKRALQNIKNAVKDVGKDFAKVWKNGTGLKLCGNILKALGQIGDILGDIAKAFRDAWNDGGTGKKLIQSYFDKWNSILDLLHSIGESARKVWNNGTGQSILSNIFKILTNINTLYSNLAGNVKRAWENNNTGTGILQNLANTVDDILKSASDISEYWSNWAGAVDLNPLFVQFENLTGSFEELVENAGNTVTWVHENIIGPIAKWAVEDAVPSSFSALSGAIDALNSYLDTLKPLGKWLLNKLLKPLGKWTSKKIVGALDVLGEEFKKLSDWIRENKPIVQGMTGVVAAFSLAWAGITFGEFLINAGGVTALLNNITKALKAATLAKIADKIESAKLIALYVKDFAISLANQVKQLAISAGAWAANTASLVATTAATVAHTVATTAAAAATTALNSALAILTSPITLVIAAIAALIGIVILLIKNWDKVKEVAIRVWKKITQSVSVAIEKIKEVCGGIGQWFKNIFTKAWAGVKDAWNGTKNFFSGICTGIKNVFSGIGGWFKNIFTKAWEGIKTAWSGTKGFFSGIWSGIKSAFSNVAGWFKDVFKTAWQGVKDVFSTGGKIFDGIKEGIADVFKTVVNGLIGGINKVISVPFNAINKMLNDIRNVGVGGVKPFKGLWDENPLDVPQIPKLAQGGYVKANTPQLAMIGDNRHQGEIVSPEGKLQEMINKAKSMDSAALDMILEYLQLIYEKDTTTYVYLKGEMEELFTAFQRKAREYTARTKKAAFPGPKQP